MTATPIQIIGAALFAIAILHTFATKFFERLAHAGPRHAGLWHLLGEIEVVFGFWAMVLMIAMFALVGSAPAIEYIESRNFTEPMFVFAIMVIAGTRPILHAASALVSLIARAIPLPGSAAAYFTVLSVVPLLGSFITEPAAMTLAALILRDQFFTRGISTRLMYLTLGVLFVNISIGGTLTPFAAPPVLMVAAKWDWNTSFMLTHFGWKAAIAVGINALLVTLVSLRELGALAPAGNDAATPRVPLVLTLVHIAFLIGVVVFAHHPPLFMGLFLFFLGVAHAYTRHQDRLILKEGLLVAFFLAGLVVLGGQQQWWLQPLLMSMSSDAVFIGATALTAFTDNAALTYLGSLISGMSEAAKYSLVAGAVAGGGLTVIANAPNPAGYSTLNPSFGPNGISAIKLFLNALVPTAIAALCFWFL